MVEADQVADIQNVAGDLVEGVVSGVEFGEGLRISWG